MPCANSNWISRIIIETTLNQAKNSMHCYLIAYGSLYSKTTFYTSYCNTEAKYFSSCYFAFHFQFSYKAQHMNMCIDIFRVCLRHILVYYMYIFVHRASILCEALHLFKSKDYTRANRDGKNIHWHNSICPSICMC